MYRYERKYIIPRFMMSDIDYIIRSSPFSCRTVHRPRMVNNIYFDSILLQAYYENIDGNYNKAKYRIRWYGDQLRYVENIRLEIKIKHNQLGYKESYILSPYDTRRAINYSSIYNMLENSKLPLEIYQKLKLMQPTLLNSYKRKYYESFDRKLRITIDENIINKSLLSNKPSFNIYRNIDSILELKYQHKYNEYVANIVSNLPLKLTKYSKYITGMQYTINISD